MDTLDHHLGEIEHAQTSMEQSMNEKFGALFDAREVQNDVNKAILSDLSAIKATLKETEIRSISASNFMTRLKTTIAADEYEVSVAAQ